LWGLRKFYSAGPEHVFGGHVYVGGREDLSFLEIINIDCSVGEPNTNSIEE